MSLSQNRRGFASDNNAGVHPNILTALTKVNDGHVIAYGDDPYTEKASAQLREIFGQETEVFFVFIGTAANVLGLSTVTQSYNAVICPETAHINVDECGAPEKFSGCKLLTCNTPDGKLTVDMIASHMHGIGFEHHVQPRMVSITQATELGTVYTVDEIREIARYTHEHGMLLHMDGARISNAAVSLGSDFYEMTGGAGVDVLSFGGTKNGMMYGEAIIFFDQALCKDFKYRRKQGMQLASKMRYIAAQFSTFLENELWKENASHANRMARKLYASVKDIPGLEVTREVESNAVFARIPSHVIPALQDEFFFYIWDEELSEVRWMCSFDTTEADIESFASLLRSML
ncbi:MAG: aminotransferase class V-fold PLP-dependent enzyme [Bacteroidales bacterium]|nr:aminotransferase class V-fold PLP-dependent enzyme [Bacteroidales bacterium]